MREYSGVLKIIEVSNSESSLRDAITQALNSTEATIIDFGRNLNLNQEKAEMGALPKVTHQSQVSPVLQENLEQEVEAEVEQLSLIAVEMVAKEEKGAKEEEEEAAAAAVWIWME